MNDLTILDQEAIRELIGNWYVYRDAGLWDDFRQVWHEDGQMVASWSQSGFETFIQNTQAGMDRGRSILHMPGLSAIKVHGSRATSMTKMLILQRDTVDGVLCDASCLSRHFDFWEKRQGRWGLVLRESIYDKAWILPVRPGETLVIDETLWNQFPPEYAALAYLQEKIGGKVKRGMPCGREGEAVKELYARGEAWLAGTATAPW
nr:nuclear transport factor 2 family protein [uncultured Holophaga sp.]